MVITGTLVALPTVIAPGPVAVSVTAVPLIDKLPAPELVDNTRLPESYTEPADNAPAIPAPPATTNAPVVELVAAVVDLMYKRGLPPLYWKRPISFAEP